MVPTEDWYTLRRRLHSPAVKTGLMIFCALIMSRNSGKLCTRQVNRPLGLASPVALPTCYNKAAGLTPCCFSAPKNDLPCGR